MEEIITVDGIQFKLSTDRPLTVQEKTQTIAEIRKQTGCGTCGPKTLSPRPSIKSMAACAAGSKNAGETITLTVTAISGVAPYTTKYFKNLGPGSLSTSRVEIPLASVVGATGAIAADGGNDNGIYTITDGDAADADWTGDGIGAKSGIIQFTGQITDSCPTGALTCEAACELTITCSTPTCNFTVT